MPRTALKATFALTLFFVLLRWQAAQAETTDGKFYLDPVQATRALIASGVKVQAGEAADRELLVGYRTARSGATVQSVATSVGELRAHSDTLNVSRIRLRAGLSMQEAVTVLAKRSDVLYVEPNYVLHHLSTPNDTSYATKQYAPQKIQADKAWDIWRPKQQIIIAVVDSGVDGQHPDLKNVMLRTSSGTINGYDAINGVASVAADDNGHGSHCSGIAAAEANNKTGIAGIAGWIGDTSTTTSSYVRIMPVKALNSTGDGYTSDIADGITWAADHGAKVISLSVGTTSYSATLNTAVQYAWGKGCVLAAAAGNDGLNQKNYPAALTNVLAVAATDSGDTLTDYSNYGTWVDCAAPGDNIYSTVPTSMGSYDTYSGTSMATPVIAGVAALIMAQNPSLTNTQVNSLIISNGNSYSPYYGSLATGSGRVNAYKSLLAAGGGTSIREIVFQNQAGGNIVHWLMNGTQIAIGDTIATGVGSQWKVAGVYDLNADGQSDILWQNTQTGDIAYWLMDGTTILRGGYITYGLSTQWSIVGTGDFNGDGKPDILLQNTVTGDIAVWFMNGTTISSGTILYSGLSTQWRVAGVADFNSDGKPDILLQNASTGQVAVWFMSGTGIVSGSILFNGIASNLRIVGTPDLNGDGKPDILWQNTQTGDVVYWYLNGTQYVSGGTIAYAVATTYQIVGTR